MCLSLPGVAGSAGGWGELGGGEPSFRLPNESSSVDIVDVDRLSAFCGRMTRVG